MGDVVEIRGESDVPSGGAPLGVNKVTKARVVKSRSTGGASLRAVQAAVQTVYCDECGAEEGQPCRVARASAELRPYCHRVRIDAWRAHDRSLGSAEKVT